jgi:hypothetical protein
MAFVVKICETLLRKTYFLNVTQQFYSSLKFKIFSVKKRSLESTIKGGKLLQKIARPLFPLIR